MSLKYRNTISKKHFNAVNRQQICQVSLICHVFFSKDNRPWLNTMFTLHMKMFFFGVLKYITSWFTVNVILYIYKLKSLEYWSCIQRKQEDSNTSQNLLWNEVSIIFCVHPILDPWRFYLKKKMLWCISKFFFLDCKKCLCQLDVCDFLYE